jgi:hypothetical protein
MPPAKLLVSLEAMPTRPVGPRSLQHGPHAHAPPLVLLPAVALQAADLGGAAGEPSRGRFPERGGFVGDALI